MIEPKSDVQGDGQRRTTPVANRAADDSVPCSDHTESVDPIINLARYIERGKNSPALSGISWDSMVWTFDDKDPVAQKTSLHRAYRHELVFANRASSKRGTSRVPASRKETMQQPFLNFARANVRLHAESSSPNITILRKRMAVLAILEEILIEDSGEADPTELGSAHFNEAERRLLTEFAPRTAYKMSNLLGDIGNVLDRHRIGAQVIRYKTRIKRPNDGDELTPQGETEGAAKMISTEALNALAAISSNPTSDTEKLICRCLDLLVCTGFRAGELLTLPLDCWVEESTEEQRIDPSSGAPVSNCGIRYAAKKTRELDVKWIPTAAIPLAKRAIADLTELCRPAREMAVWLDANPGRIWHFRGYNRDEIVPLKTVLELLNIENTTATTQFAETYNIPVKKVWGKIGQKGATSQLLTEIGQVESALLKTVLLKPLFTLKNGKQQALRESLIVIFENQLHPLRATLEFCPRQLTFTLFSSAICLTDGQVAERAKNQHERYDILAKARDSDGNPIRVTTHQFRHWLNTLAANEGVSDLDLAKWMGRTDLRQNEAYKHLKSSTRVALAREMVLDGRAEGSIARTARTINDPVERRAYVEARVLAAHTTPYGICTHNYAAKPCTRHLNCLAGKTGKGCPELQRTVGNQNERSELKKLKAETQANLEKAKAAMTTGEYGASQWVQAHEDTLRGITAALSVDTDLAPNNGKLAQVFSNLNAKPS